MISTVMYRNPMEEWMWESGFAPWFIIIVLTLFLISAIVDAYSGWARRRHDKRRQDFIEGKKLARFRHACRPSRVREDGVRSFRIGVTCGWWPCLGGPFVQFYVGFWVHDFWYGTQSYQSS